MSRKGASGGYHGDLSIPGYKPKTPTVAPPKKWAARGPAGTYAGAAKEYEAAVTALPPAAEAVTRTATRQAAKKRAVRAQRKRQKAALRLTQDKPKAKVQKKGPEPYKAPQVAKPKVITPEGPTPAIRKQEVVDARAFAREQERPMPKVVRKQPKAAKAKGQDPATAVMSSVPGRGPEATRQRRRAARKELRQAKRAVRRTARPADLPHLGPEEERVARTVLGTGERRDANLKEQLAAAETGLVETGFKNLAGGDADSEGWRQERRMYYPNPTNVKASSNRFYDEIVGDTGGSRGKGMTAGQLAQAVQASAYPERYDERKPEALDIVKAFERGQADPQAVKRLQTAKVKAEKLGLKVAVPKGSLGPPPKKVVTRFKAAKQAAQQLEKLKLPYVWGGGHNAGNVELGSGVDCSGAVSYVLQKMGVKLPGGVVSGEMGSYLKPGPGAVTVFYNPTHTFMRIGNRYFGTSGTNPEGGAGWIEGTPDDLSKYSVGHVPGLGKKVALQLGISDFSGGGSFPGVSFSNGGTTATVTSGTTVKEPGFSKKPITAQQKFVRTNRKLKELGVGESSTATSQSSSSVLDELARKYAVA